VGIFKQGDNLAIRWTKCIHIIDLNSNCVISQKSAPSCPVDGTSDVAVDDYSYIHFVWLANYFEQHDFESDRVYARLATNDTRYPYAVVIKVITN
jgi:hypothetical protein